MTTVAVKLLKSLADDTRLRIVRLLFREELNVYEIARILDIPQPSVSRHLAVLKRVGLVADRRDGTRIFYTLTDQTSAPASFVGLVRELAEEEHEDVKRLEDVVALRAQASKSLMDRRAEHWDEIVGMLHNSAASLLAMANMAPRGMVVGDLGTGTGLLLPVLSAMAAEVHAVDQSAAMLRRARNRCRQAGLANVVFHHADVQGLEDSFPPCDALLLHFVLHQVPRPAALFPQLADLLTSGGRLLVVDRCKHDDERAKELFGSVWLGFEREKLEQWLREAGLETLFWQVVAGKTAGGGTGDTFVCAAGRRPAGLAS